MFCSDPDCVRKLQQLLGVRPASNIDLLAKGHGSCFGIKINLALSDTDGFK